MALPKTYQAMAVLGARSDTLDRTGKIEQCGGVIVSQNQIEVVAKDFVGEIEQKIPEYSAAKVNGVPRYKLAREGKVQVQKSKLVTIYNLEIINSNYLNNRSIVEFEATVSSGTYIRQLSYDLFRTLGVESYLETLMRTQIGNYTMGNCAQVTDFETEEWKGKVKLLLLPVRDE